jgi:hypothetical protein
MPAISCPLGGISGVIHTIAALGEWRAQLHWLVNRTEDSRSKPWATAMGAAWPH